MIKQIGPEEYKEICSWWAAHGFPVLQPQTLPSTGYVWVNDTKSVIASFLYLPKDPVNIAWMDWTVANPEANQAERCDGLKGLVDHINEEARKAGIQLVVTNTPHTKFGKKLEDVGFKATETGTNYIRFVS